MTGIPSSMKNVQVHYVQILKVRNKPVVRKLILHAILSIPPYGYLTLFKKTVCIYEFLAILHCTRFSKFLFFFSHNYFSLQNVASSEPILASSPLLCETYSIYTFYSSLITGEIRVLSYDWLSRLHVSFFSQSSKRVITQQEVACNYL